MLLTRFTQRIVNRFAFCLLVGASAAHAQINVMSQPFRAGTAPSSSAELTVASVAPQAITNSAPHLAVRSLNRPSAVAGSTGQSTAKHSVAAPRRWAILAEDQTLSRALERWALQEGLELVWEAPKDLAVVRAMYLGPFEKVIREVMLDTRSDGYPLHACRSGGVLRVLQSSQPCNI